MKRRAPRLIWRLLAGDVWRLLALTTCSLVTLIAFAGAVKPLADGKVGLIDALTLMGLLVVPMLQFALPFASGFAATIGYHRFAADNEAMASHAGGVGHRALLVPALATGLVVGVALAGLSNEVIPRFLRRAELLITRDATRVFVRPIERGESVRIGPYDVYAQRVLRVRPEGAEQNSDGSAAPGVLDHLVLQGVLAVQSDDRGVRTWLNAKRVDLWVLDDDGAEESGQGAAVQLVFSQVEGDVPEGTLSGDELVTQRIVIPGAFRDDPKFLPLRELLAVQREPRRIGAVEQRHRLLAAALAQAAIVSRIDEQLRRDGHAALVREGERLVLSAAGLRADGNAWVIEPRAGGGPALALVVRRDDGIERILHATGGRIELMTAPTATERTPASGPVVGVRLELANVAAVGAGASAADGGERTRRIFTGLAAEGDAYGARLEERSRELIREARALTEAPGAQPLITPELSRQIASTARNLRTRSMEIRQEATGKLHERFALSAACVLMVLTGAVMAMRLRDSLPLPVYLWSFFPALVTVITANAGAGMVQRVGGPGLLLLWGGVAALAAYTWRAFTLLRRH